MSTSSIYMSIEICQFLQVGLGISANAFLLLFHVFMLLLDHRRKPTDLTTCHLAFVHMMKLLTVLFMLSKDVFDTLSLPKNFQCKAYICIIRMTRGLSMSTTCLLSTLQAIVISPSTSWLARFKQKCSKYIFHSFIILWFFSLSLYSNCILYTAAASNVTQKNILHISKHCSLSPVRLIIRWLLLILTLPRDVFIIGAMLLSSAYMVVLLSRHQRRCRHLHSTHLSSRVSPERRATQTVLLLVTFFVVMYLIDVIISFSVTMLWRYDPVTLGFQKLLANVYATVSAFVVICSDKRIKMCFKSVGKFQSMDN